MSRIVQTTEHLWIAPSRFWQTNAGVWLSGGAACLIDPGVYPDEIAALARLTVEQGVASQIVVLTHSHWDHILGPERFPEAQVVAHAVFAACATGSEGAGEVDHWFAREGIARERPFVAPRPDLVFEQEVTLAVGDLSLRLIHAPGHAADQFVVYHAESAALWAADMLSDLEPPLVAHSLAAYERTLARLAELEVRLLIPGHGQPTREAGEIGARLAEDRAYLEELRERVGRAVREGKTVEEAVALCAQMRYRRPEENAGEHRRNVEGVYVELGGGPRMREIHDYQKEAHLNQNLSLSFEQMTEADIPALTEVMTRAFDDDSQKHLGKEKGGPPGYDDGEFFCKWLLGYEQSIGFKIVSEGVVIGGLMVWDMEDGHNFLGTLFVDPAYQDRGVGTRAWHFVEQTYPRAKSWSLGTPVWAVKNHHFYETKCGFRRVRVEGDEIKYRKDMT